MKHKYLAILAAGLLVGPAVASADTIDFEAVADGNNGNPLALTEATIENTSGGDVWVGTSAAGQRQGFCFGDDVSCAFDGTLVFATAVQDLAFNIDGWDAIGDAITISFFNGSSLLGSFIVSGNGRQDFSIYGLITRLIFDDSSIVDPTYETGNGVGYSRFFFNTPAASVPEPGTLALLGLGLAGLGFSRRRKQA